MCVCVCVLERGRGVGHNLMPYADLKVYFSNDDITVS